MNLKLLNMDCMEYMKTVPDKYFDIMITSPPYNMNLRVNQKGDGYCSRQIIKEMSSKYARYSDNMPMDVYEKFLIDFVGEALRVSEIVFLNIQQITGNKPAVARMLGEYASQLKETIIWDKVVAQPSIADRTLNSQFEFIYVFGANPIARQFYNARFERGTVSNIWKIRPTARHQSDHGAGFPIAIPAKILELFSIKGSKVIDPFVGTGTTAIAAHYFGAGEFTGVDIDCQYLESAKKRIDSETRQQSFI